MLASPATSCWHARRSPSQHQSQSERYRERTQSGMPVLNGASNQRSPARAARKKRTAGRGRPPAKPHQTSPNDSPSCHPGFLPPPFIRNQNPMDLQTTMEG
eukprot:220054-Chlamydomonas_euryale.AAC.1